VGESGLGRFQVVPPLSAEEFAALKADIAQRGVLVPVECDEDGNVLDGHHRIRACRELGIAKWPKIIRRDLGDDRAKRAHARALNLARRHLSAEAKRQIIAEQLRDAPAQTNRAVTREIGVSHHTVEAVRSELERNGQIAQYEHAMDEAEVSRPGPRPAAGKGGAPGSGPRLDRPRACPRGHPQFWGQPWAGSANRGSRAASRAAGPAPRARKAGGGHVGPQAPPPVALVPVGDGRGPSGSAPRDLARPPGGLAIPTGAVAVKTDRNNARGAARPLRMGWFRATWRFS